MLRKAEQIVQGVEPQSLRDNHVLRQLAANEGRTFHLVTEKNLQDGPLLRNVQLANRYRQTQTDSSLLLTLEHSVCDRGTPLADLCRSAQQHHVSYVRTHVFHLLSNGDLAFDPRKEPIGDQTLIFPKGVILVTFRFLYNLPREWRLSMAFEPGGYADKLGNRFEGRWVARQLLFLLNEQLRSVTLEAVGDDQTGVDLWIERNDETREAQQCKAENGTKAKWTLNDLKNRGVLDHARTQLDRNPQYRFTFVSSSPAPQLRDLSRSAQDSKGDSESFYADQIKTGRRDRQAAYSDWCCLFGLDESNAEDRAIAFDLLERSGFHLFSDTRETREELKWMARQTAVGDPDAVLALLAEFAADNLRRTIISADVRRHLEESGFQIRKLFADDRIIPRLDELRDDFDDSIKPHLAGGKMIPRSELDEVFALLDDESHADAIVLHGAAGHGKSGVLYQLTCQLHERGTPFLALRLDRKSPAGSARVRRVL